MSAAAPSESDQECPAGGTLVGSDPAVPDYLLPGRFPSEIQWSVFDDDDICVHPLVEDDMRRLGMTV